MQKNKIQPTFDRYIESLESEFDQISDSRKAQLKQLGQYIRDKNSAGETAQLVVICTHNSRRSHLGQAWLQAAAEYYGLDRIETFSGGTETTAFNPRAVEALQHAGFRIQKTAETENPVYEITFGPEKKTLKMFSKKYDDPANPKNEFAAVMVCSEADAGCPLVPGAERRFSLPYEDPKIFDGTPGEADAYRERSREIAREMFFAMTQVAD